MSTYMRGKMRSRGGNGGGREGERERKDWKVYTSCSLPYCYIIYYAIEMQHNNIIIIIIIFHESSSISSLNPDKVESGSMRELVYNSLDLSVP